MKNQKSSKTLQTQTEASTKPNKRQVENITKYLEHISQILIQCLKFESILTANIDPGLLVDK